MPPPPSLPPSPPDQPASHPPLAGSTPPPPPLQHGGLHTQQPQQEGGREPEDPGAGVGAAAAAEAAAGEAGGGKGATRARQEVSTSRPRFFTFYVGSKIAVGPPFKCNIKHLDAEIQYWTDVQQQPQLKELCVQSPPHPPPTPPLCSCMTRIKSFLAANGFNLTCSPCT